MIHVGIAGKQHHVNMIPAKEFHLFDGGRKIEL
jgi:hypothetical protein